MIRREMQHGVFDDGCLGGRYRTALTERWRRRSVLRLYLRLKNPGQVNPFSPEISGQTCPSFSPAKESLRECRNHTRQDEMAMRLTVRTASVGLKTPASNCRKFRDSAIEI